MAGDECGEEAHQTSSPSTRNGGLSKTVNKFNAPAKKHAEMCFQRMLQREQELWQHGWAAFYHLYTFPAVIYEINAAVAALYLSYPSRERGPLPRLLPSNFLKSPCAQELRNQFEKNEFSGQKDHNPDFRRVGISAMCALNASGPEADLASNFTAPTFNCTDLNYFKVLLDLLRSLGISDDEVESVAMRILELSAGCGLNVHQFRHKPQSRGESGGGSSGPVVGRNPPPQFGVHLLQIFIRMELVDSLAYASQPYGVPDEKRSPLSRWLQTATSTSYGQVRIVCRPDVFVQDSCVRMYSECCDESFHSNRERLQSGLQAILAQALTEQDSPSQMIAPSWWPSKSLEPLEKLLEHTREVLSNAGIMWAAPAVSRVRPEEPVQKKEALLTSVEQEAKQKEAQAVEDDKAAKRASEDNSRSSVRRGIVAIMRAKRRGRSEQQTTEQVRACSSTSGDDKDPLERAAMMMKARQHREAAAAKEEDATMKSRAALVEDEEIERPAKRRKQSHGEEVGCTTLDTWTARAALAERHHLISILDATLLQVTTPV